MASFASVSSSAVTSVVDHALHFVDDLVHGRRGDVGPHACAHGKRPGTSPERKLRPGAIRVALGFAQIQVDPARKEPAKNRIHHAQAHVVGARARDADRGDPQLRLRRAGPIHQHQPRLRERGVAELRRRRCPARPASEGRLRELPQLGQRNRSGNDERGVGRNELTAPETMQVVARDSLDGISRAELGKSIWMLEPVQRRTPSRCSRRCSGCSAAGRHRRALPREYARLPRSETSIEARRPQGC